MSRPYRLLQVTDWHVPKHHPGFFAALAGLTKEVRFDTKVAGGDVVDLDALKRFDPDALDQDPWGVAEELELAVKLWRGLKAADDGVFLGGNHEARWTKAVVGKNTRALRGLLDMLSIEAAFRHVGLPKGTRWVEEQVGVPGFIVGRGAGKTNIRHGDRQSIKGFGAPSAAKRLARDPGMNHACGHSHVAELATASSMGRTWWSMRVPGATKLANYTQGGNPNWQLGGATIEWPNGLGGEAQPTIILASRLDGSFAWGGQVFRP